MISSLVGTGDAMLRLVLRWKAPGLDGLGGGSDERRAAGSGEVLRGEVGTRSGKGLGDGAGGGSTTTASGTVGAGILRA